MRFLIKKSQVFLTSSPRNICQIQQCCLLLPLPFSTSCLSGEECGDRTKSFDSFERRREEWSPPKKLQKECHRTARWPERKENQAAASRRDIPTCGHRQQDRADKGLLALPAASSSLHSLHKLSPFSESSC